MAIGALSGFRNKKFPRHKGALCRTNHPKKSPGTSPDRESVHRTRFSRYSLPCNQRFLPPLTSPFCGPNHETRPENKPPSETSLQKSQMYLLLATKNSASREKTQARH